MIEKATDQDGSGFPFDYRNYLMPANQSSSTEHISICITSQVHHNDLWHSHIPTRYISLKPASRSIIKRVNYDHHNRNNNSSNNDGASGDQDSCGNNAADKKNVSFADHKGLALAVIIDISETSELSWKFSEVDLDAVVAEGEKSYVTDEPPLILNFKQPASDYMNFRDHLEKNCVSLENVILKDYSMLGTIKVKNIAYDKTVFVRLTYDSWDSFIDASACLASTTSSHYYTRPSVFETFTFEIEIPTNLDIKKKIEFAVCFDVNGHQYWDNNDGTNYQILSTEWKSHKEQLRGMDSVSEVRDCESWSDFACWDNVDTSMPYW